MDGERGKRRPRSSCELAVDEQRTFSGQTCQSLATSHQVFVWSSVLKPPILHPDFGSALDL